METLTKLMLWLSDHGTNDWVKGFVTNNFYIVSPIAAVIGAWLKGKNPEFWAKLATMLPGVGKPKGQI